LLLLQEKKSSIEFASPPRKEITYGICFSSKKEITYGICLFSKKEITYGISPSIIILYYPSGIILKYFSPILSLDRILLELESR
jgi:hypothetical protein